MNAVKLDKANALISKINGIQLELNMVETMPVNSRYLTTEQSQEILDLRLKHLTTQVNKFQKEFNEL